MENQGWWKSGQVSPLFHNALGHSTQQCVGRSRRTSRRVKNFQPNSPYEHVGFPIVTPASHHFRTRLSSGHPQNRYLPVAASCSVAFAGSALMRMMA